MLALKKLLVLSISKMKVIINRKSLQKLQKKLTKILGIIDRNSKNVRPTLVKCGTFLTL